MSPTRAVILPRGANTHVLDAYLLVDEQGEIVQAGAVLFPDLLRYGERFVPNKPPPATAEAARRALVALLRETADTIENQVWSIKENQG